MLKSWNEMRTLDISKYVKKRDGADYLPWASCLKLLYENGAENVRIIPVSNEKGSSLFMSDQTFTDKNGVTNRCYEVRVLVYIDDKDYTISYPVMNGIAPVRDNLMNQNSVHKAQMRAFVKCVAINTGLGFDLWLDDDDIEDDKDDLGKGGLSVDGCPGIDVLEEAFLFLVGKLIREKVLAFVQRLHIVLHLLILLRASRLRVDIAVVKLFDKTIHGSFSLFY